MKKVIRQNRNGQITLPKAMREAAHISPDDLLEVELVGRKFTIEPVRTAKRADWVKDLYDLFAPVREALKDVPEEEINKAIDEAVAAYRAHEK